MTATVNRAVQPSRSHRTHGRTDGLTEKGLQVRGDLSGRNARVAGGPQRIQLKRTKGWRKPDGAIVVARPTKWGNPYKVGGHPIAGTDRAAGPVTAQQCVDAYRALFDHAGWGDRLDLTELEGHDLACWCPLDQPCHADVLLKLANRDPYGRPGDGPFCDETWRLPHGQLLVCQRGPRHRDPTDGRPHKDVTGLHWSDDERAAGALR